MFPILFQLGPITLHTYGLMVALGFLGGLSIARIQFARFGLPVMLLDRIVLYLMLFGLLGARTLFFLLQNMDAFFVDPLSFFRIWEGGLVFYGGVIAGLITLAVFAYRYRLNFLSLTDAFAAPLLLAHALGRIGCFSAGCCYGRPSSLPWAVTFTHPATLAPRFVALHPTQIYESVGNFVLFLIAFKLGQRKPARGVLTSFYAISYGTFRFVMEFLRGDDRGAFLLGASPSQIVALCLIAIGIGIIVYEKKERAR